MTKAAGNALELGLYRVHWTKACGGGTSVAAVGMWDDGTRWLAPTNWLEPSMKPKWSDVQRMELICTQNSRWPVTFCRE